MIDSVPRLRKNDTLKVVINNSIKGNIKCAELIKQALDDACERNEFKFHNTNFCKELELIFGIDCLKLDVQYIKFKGYTRLYWSPETPTKAEKINAEMPELKLYERYMNWTGTCYNIIVLELSVLNSEKQYAVAYTTNTINNYINSLVKNYISSGEFYAEYRAPRIHAAHYDKGSCRCVY